ncbi:MAG: amino acid adenylation domain-containing protein [Acidobacteriota bacterium]
MAEPRYSGRPAIHQLFAQQVERDPTATAVICGAERWSYGELDQRARAIASRLGGAGAGPETLVGLCLERSPLAAAAMLGTLQAGAGFVPMDPTNPAERLTYLLDDARAPVVLTRAAYGESLQDAPSEVIDLEALDDPVGGEVFGEEPRERTAYVVYTSGSTGRPKGVVVSQTTFVPLLYWGRELFGLGPDTRAVQTLSFGFDFGVFEVLSTLVFGGTLIFPERHELKNLERLAELAAEHRANVIHSTPSIVRQILALGGRLDTVEIVHLGGEPIPRSLSQAIFAASAPGCRLFNGYGPTEVTVNSAIFEQRADGSEIPEELPIGHITVDTTGYLASRHGDPVAPGEVGELLLGGGGVARGYLRRPALTAERFVPDPFSTEEGARLYKSGDQTRALPDGNLMFLGRFDHQIKLRGFRIELGEVESALSAHPAVRETAAMVVGEGGGRRLAACVLAAPGRPPTSGELRRHAKGSLPEHMVPTRLLVLERFPLTESGKVDRQALSRLAADGEASGAASEHEPIPDLARAFDEQSNLTVNQSLFWFIHQLQSGRQLYYDRTPVSFTLEGEIDPHHFRRAFQQVVDGSDILRSRILEVDDLPRRVVDREVAAPVDVVDLSQAGDPSAALAQWLEARREIDMRFDSKLFDCALIKLTPQRTVWYFNLFHILADAWSIALIFRRVAEGYQRSLDEDPETLPALVPFSRQIELDHQQRASPRFEKAEEYWRQKLAQPLLPNRFFGTTDTPTTSRTRRLIVELGAERSQRIRDTAKQNGLFSPAVFFATVLFAYLYRLSGERRLRLGSPFANRQPQFRECIGLFMTVCPTEVEIADGETFLSLARKAQVEIAHTTRHEFYPVRNPVHRPAYDVHLNYQNISFQDFAGLPAHVDLLMAGRSNDHLNVQVRDFDESGSFSLDLDFNQSFFDEAQGQLAADHYLRLIDAMVADGQQPIESVDMLSGAERERLQTLSAGAAREWLGADATDAAQLYILDRWSGLLPEGVTGEVYLGGVEASNGREPVADPFGAASHLVPTGQRARLVDGRAEVIRDDSEAEDLATETANVPYVAPRSPLESTLADIYAHVLGTDRVGIHEDFFGLGGNSLLATQLVLALRQELEQQVPLRWVFEAPSVAELGERIDQNPGG